MTKESGYYRINHSTERPLLFLGYFAPIPMGLIARFAACKFTLLSGLRSTSRAGNIEGLFLGLHGDMIRHCRVSKTVQF
jgi:hypothetical protein